MFVDSIYSFGISTNLDS